MSTALAPLWTIEAELVALLDSVETCPEELQPELQARIDAYMGQEVSKVDQIAHVLAALEYEQKAAGDEIARLQERKKAAAKAQDRLEAYVCRVIASRGRPRLEGRTNTLSVRPSEAVVITSADAVPENFKTVSLTMPYTVWFRVSGEFPDLSGPSVSVDKAAIKKALKAGDDVPGADLEYRSNLVRK